MRLTRRNTIIGLGSLAIGAGAIGGSGAFSSVEAQRSFEVSVSGDAGALLGLEATNDTIAGTESGGAGGNDIIYFRLADGMSLNEGSTSSFDESLRVTNNGDNTVQLTLSFEGGMEGVYFTLADERGDPETDLTDEGVELTPGESVMLDLVINTHDTDDDPDGGYVEPEEGDPYQITIRAESVDR